MVVHVGFSGFPFGNASVQRVRLTFKGLKKAGLNPLVINKISHHSKDSEKKLGCSEGIPYLNTAFLPYRPSSFAGRNLNKVSGYFGEFFFFFKKRKNIDAVILYSTYFLELPYYWLLSKIFGFKIVIQYVELFSSIPGRSSFFTKLNDRLIDQHFYKFCDGVIAISDFLAHHVQSKSPNLPLIKLPAICDFTEFDGIPPYKDHEEQPYLMYCGTIYYAEVIELIVGVFENLKKDHAYRGGLILVISGDHPESRERLNLKMEKTNCRNSITVKSNIPYKELLSLYKGASILMIPLRDTLQDNARFPHKIGEYTAAKRPILSTNIGELKSYFTDGQSALLTDEYSETAYTSKLAAALALPGNNLDSIGEKGYQIGLANFDYHRQGEALKKFLLQTGLKARYK